MTYEPTASGIRAARKAAGLSQEAAGALIGVERRTVMRWESGERRPPAERAVFTALINALAAKKRT